jgi:hypothetical protein
MGKISAVNFEMGAAGNSSIFAGWLDYVVAEGRLVRPVTFDLRVGVNEVEAVVVLVDFVLYTGELSVSSCESNNLLLSDRCESWASVVFFSETSIELYWLTALNGTSIIDKPGLNSDSLLVFLCNKCHILTFDLQISEVS